eukprot:9042862-Pyramimonas_sp.AAC.1
MCAMRKACVVSCGCGVPECCPCCGRCSTLPVGRGAASRVSASVRRVCLGCCCGGGVAGHPPRT